MRCAKAPGAKVRGCAGRIVSAGALGAFAIAAQVLAAQSLPEGPGAAVLGARCASCHGSDLIVSQRLSAAGWGRELDKMVRWGARVDAAERDALVPYLASHFGPRPALSHATDTTPPGATIYTRACLSCHDGDLIDQQRLTRAGWVREVEKMMRWGARVADAERDPLVDYLVSRQPLR